MGIVWHPKERFHRKFDIPIYSDVSISTVQNLFCFASKRKKNAKNSFLMSLLVAVGLGRD